jgi:acyl carrier protein phosphodiesterase
MADGFGEQFKNYPVDVQKIILHRAIDTFDAHPVLDKVLKTAFKIPSLCWCDR